MCDMDNGSQRMKQLLTLSFATGAGECLEGAWQVSMQFRADAALYIL